MDFPELPDMSPPLELLWRVHQLDPDEIVEGWLAGPVKRVMTHFWASRTVPCCSLLSEGQVPCECNVTPSPIRVTGYMPIITKTGDRLVVMLSSTVSATVQAWPFASPVRVRRSSRQKRPLDIKRLHVDELSASHRAAISAKGPQDIKRYLLHLWQNKALCQHFGFEFKASAATQAALGKLPDAE